MKTAMRILKEEIQSKVFQPTNLTNYQYGHNVAYGTVLTIVEYLLEKEKEQIINAHTNAYLIGEDDISVEDANEASIKYYNQTYNKEPKKEYEPSEEYLKKQRDNMEDYIWNRMNKNNQ